MAGADTGQFTQAEYEDLQQAAEWFALLCAETATDSERAAWRLWFEQSERHRRAWQLIEAAGRRFEPLQANGNRKLATETLTALRGRRIGRRRALNLLALVAGGGMAAAGAWRYTALPTLTSNLTADYRTGTGELRDIVLSDGTRLWLNTASAVNSDYRPAQRRLQLIAGEILIETGHDETAARPFVVDTAHGRLRALGTRFSVREYDDSTGVSVYDGAVEISHAGGAQVIEAGRQVRFTRAAVSASTAADPARQAWSGGVLLADDIALRDLLEELGRYRNGFIRVAPEVADLRVMGAFPLRDSERALAMLADALTVRVRRVLPWWISVEPRVQ